MSEKYEITTAKGRKTGTLLECLTWQAEYQGAMADIIAPDGRRCRLDGMRAEDIDLGIGIAFDDDPARDESDITPAEAEAKIMEWFASNPDA
jgi:hypothetical protein